MIDWKSLGLGEGGSGRPPLESDSLHPIAAGLDMLQMSYGSVGDYVRNREQLERGFATLRYGTLFDPNVANVSEAIDDDVLALLGFMIERDLQITEAELNQHVWNRGGLESRMRRTMTLARLAGYVLRALEVDGRNRPES
jgi:hypothetical protein